jgi:hypothetical protein
MSQVGSSVSINNDGTYALVGGVNDNNGIGACWIFIRNGGGVWSQNGLKMTPLDATAFASVGQSVSISGDSNYIMEQCGHFPVLYFTLNPKLGDMRMLSEIHPSSSFSNLREFTPR